jgi:putative iron-regulated protein
MTEKATAQHMYLGNGIARWLGLVAVFLGLPGYSESIQTNQAPLEELKKNVVSQYAVMLEAEYEDSLTSARALQVSITAFLDHPSSDSLNAAREKWIYARHPYLQTEVGRFYDGPIELVEGHINSWPIDENYIDYTQSSPDSGMINQPGKFPEITRELLLAANEKEGKKNISLGFHAIEFLLWGQDLNPHGPGNRPFTDYVLNDASSAERIVRRRVYLKIVTGLLVENLDSLVGEWAAGKPGNYRAKFTSLPADIALGDIFNGIGSLSGTELSGERLMVPYMTKDQEDEQSCFSDTTTSDLINDEIGIQNVFFGRYTREDGSVIQGPGLDVLLGNVAPRLAAILKQQLEESGTALKSIPPPFDQAILGRDSDPGRVAIKKSLDDLHLQTASLAKAAAALNIRLNIQ